MPVNINAIIIKKYPIFILVSILIFNIILLKVIVKVKQKTGLKIVSIVNICIPLIINNFEQKSNNPGIK